MALDRSVSEQLAAAFDGMPDALPDALLDTCESVLIDVAGLCVARR